MPLSRHIAPAILALALSAAASHAQTTAPAPYEVEPLIARLNNPATRAAAAASIATLPPEALDPLYDAWKDPTLDPAAKAAIGDALPALQQRIVKDRDDRDAAASKVWAHTTGTLIYQQFGHHDPRWDAHVADAFKLIENPPGDALPDVKAAIDAGCDDPLIRYYYASRAPDTALTPQARITLYNAAIPALANAHYPPSRTLIAQLRYLNFILPAPNADALRALQAQPGQHLLAMQHTFDTAVRLLPSVAPTLGRAEADLVIGQFDDICTAMDKAGIPAHSMALPTITRLFPDNSLLEADIAEYDIVLAWQSRGNGWASSVTDSGWQGFAKKLDEAEAHALTSVRLDPAAPEGPTAMLTLCMGKSYNRPTLDYWFARAINGAPLNLDACQRKLTALLPKWGGSEQDAINFARDIALHYSGRMPLILVDAHQDLADDSGDPAAYLTNPDVWPDIAAAYEKVLDEEQKVSGTALPFDSAHYLKYAATCQEWSDFLSISKRFGKIIDIPTFGGQALLDFYTKKATAAVAPPAN